MVVSPPGAPVVGVPGTVVVGPGGFVVVGRGGLEPRADVLIGISLLAPTVAYPEHRHPPEEVYLVLSPGEWRKLESRERLEVCTQ